MADNTPERGFRSMWDDEVWCVDADEHAQELAADEVIPVIRVPLAEIIGSKPEPKIMEDWS